MKSPGLQQIFDKFGGLRTMDSLSLRIPLIESNNAATPANDETDFIRKRLTNLTIKPKTDVLVGSPLPAINQMGSFLMKHETKYIGDLGQLGNSEEFNNIVSQNDPHMTVILTWMAVINDNSSVQRITYGQHFVQLRNLYEM